MTFRLFGDACDIVAAVCLFGVGNAPLGASFLAASVILFALELSETRLR